MRVPRTPGYNSKNTLTTTTTDRGPPTISLYIPATPEGELAKRLQEAEDKFSQLYTQGWTEVIERGGTKLKDLVTNKYPWAAVSCDRDNCLLH